ncbi:MAG: hypothetical protein ACI4EA_08795 [Candidatus Ornithomonoglobus sp.]
MFLSLLSENNKRNFIDLCGYASAADGIFSDVEKETIAAYCREMNINEMIPDTTKDINTILDDLYENSNKKEKRIILFELLGLFFSDDVFTDEEQELAKKIADKFEINKEEMQKLSSLLTIYKTLYNELYLAILR